MSAEQRAKLLAIPHTPEWARKIAEGNRNTGTKWERSTSRYRGVSFARERGLWLAVLYLGKGKGRRFGGYHSTEEGAAVAWDALATKYRPELKLIFPPGLLKEPRTLKTV
jgi:hypothetical protein